MLLVAVCAIAAVVASTPLSECPDGWRSSPKSGKCFQMVDQPLTYEEAVAECEGKKGVLATVQGPADKDFIQDYVKSVAEPAYAKFWIGLQCRGEWAGHWEWLDGSEVVLEQLGDDRPPACQPAKRQCEAVFVMYGEITYRGVQCSQRRGALCQRSAVASARVVDQLEKALVQSEERVARLESQQTALAVGIVALVLHVSLLARRLSRLNGTAGDSTSGTAEEEKKRAAEKEQPTDPEDGDSDHSSFDQLVDENAE